MHLKKVLSRFTLNSNWRDAVVLPWELLFVGFLILTARGF